MSKSRAANMRPFDWLKKGLLVALLCTLAFTAEAEEEEWKVYRKHASGFAQFRRERREEMDEREYGHMMYTTYSADVDGVKKSNITMGPSLTGDKRTIKIGNQVCGATKDGKQSERWDDRRSIIPGKKRTTSENENTLNKIHICCEDHDKCPRSVPAKSTKYGFTNDIEYAIMSCKCDTGFRKCLKDIKSYTSDAIGHLYFDALKIPCLTFYDDSSEDPAHLDMVSVVPDLSIAHPKIGGAQVILKSTDSQAASAAAGHEDKEESFYTHEQPGIADSKEMGNKHSHPQLVRSLQYPTPKIKSATKSAKKRSKKGSLFERKSTV